ncbi:TetR/AcrR family transcriptional regulator [Nonomuraea sp. LPB2021202275-12-8]|uniref:TetR/AcrR family transcriptional regulator n=1 Tax=Nonomuraea sp. LPB2021202275-12-8 TaxID=3120159 RepID=UPI00300D6FDE
MVVNEHEREQAILDATADLLLRLGYNKLTMGDVAEAVALHRGLVYLHFKSKDELVEAVLVRELDRYVETWREQVEADPRGGDVASVYRAMVHVLKTLPLTSAIAARDPEVFGKYLRKPANLFGRRPSTFGMRGFLQMMQQAGTMRRDVDIRAVAFILDALTPALRRTFVAERAAQADPDQPTSDELLETLADLLDRALAPPDGADLANGRAVLLGGLDEVRTALSAALSRQEGERS